MEIIINNLHEEQSDVYDYILTETTEGSNLRKLVFINKLKWTSLYCALVISVIWAITQNILNGIIFAICIIVLYEGIPYFASKKKPNYYLAIKTLKAQDAFTSPIEKQLFELPRTIRINDDCLEMECTECQHRYKWRIIKIIRKTTSFIFFHIGKCTLLVVPKRCFQSESDYEDWFKSVNTIWERHKNDKIGD